MSERLEGITDRIEQYLYKTPRTSGKTQLFEDCKWLIGRVEQLESENEEIEKDLQRLRSKYKATKQSHYNYSQIVSELESENEKLKVDISQNAVIHNTTAYELREENERLQQSIKLAKDALEPYADNHLVQKAFKHLRSDNQ